VRRTRRKVPASFCLPARTVRRESPLVEAATHDRAGHVHGQPGAASTLLQNKISEVAIGFPTPRADSVRCWTMPSGAL